jgi:hypothetical protein
MKLTKQNKTLLGVAALGVVGYLIWKQTQKKKQEFLGFGKRRKPRQQPIIKPELVYQKEHYYMMKVDYPICLQFDCGGKTLDSNFKYYFNRGSVVYGRIILHNGKEYLEQMVQIRPTTSTFKNRDVIQKASAKIPLQNQFGGILMTRIDKPEILPVYDLLDI